MSQLKLPPYQKSQRKSYAGTPSQSVPTQSNFSTSFQLIVTAPTASNVSTSKMANDIIPPGYSAMDHFVAGHKVNVGSDEIGMLKSVDDGSVLKPGGEFYRWFIDDGVMCTEHTCDWVEFISISQEFQ